MRYNLVLEDGTEYAGYAFGARRSASGEVVFNTGMVGYCEALTDPSYRGQILVLTSPMIGNYGVPNDDSELGLSKHFESDRIQVSGLIVSDYSSAHSHWNATRSLAEWLGEHDTPALSGIDTRALTKRLREKGTMLGKMVFEGDVPFYDPNVDAIVEQVSLRRPAVYNEEGSKNIHLIDCGAKAGIIRSLIDRGCRVVRVPHDYDFLDDEPQKVVISNGPGDPKMCSRTIEIVKRCLTRGIPVFGICLGNQILGLAAGANTYKLKYGHRSQNQPCLQAGGRRCFITSQNHGFAIETETLPDAWEPWFTNVNDGTNEGIRHRSMPFMSVQFHPEHRPGPVDTEFIFDTFLELVAP